MKFNILQTNIQLQCKLLRKGEVCLLFDKIIADSSKIKKKNFLNECKWMNSKKSQHDTGMSVRFLIVELDNIIGKHVEYLSQFYSFF